MGRHKYEIVGRDHEVQQILDLVVANRSVLVVGRQGYGKSRLLDEIARREAHNGTKLSPVYVEIQSHETPETIFEELLNGAYAYQQPNPIRMNHPLVRERFDRILALFTGEVNWGAGKVSGSLGFAVGTIVQVVQALRARPEVPTDEKLLILLEALSQPIDRRIVLVFDAVAEALQGQHASWLRFVEAIRYRRLRVSCVFASRPDGPLMVNDFCRNPSITMVPDANGLQTLDEAATDDWAEQAIQEDEGRPVDLQVGLRGKESEFKAKLRQYHGWPYPLTAAINLALSGEELSAIPNDPQNVGEEIWRRLTPDAKKLMIAHLVLEVPASPRVAQAVADLTPEVHNGVVIDRFVASLLTERDLTRSLFHSLFAEEVARQMGSSDISAEPYHQRAVAYFQNRIAATRDGVPDAFAAERIVAHLLALGQTDEATGTFINDCSPLLVRAGVYEPMITWTNELVQADEISPLQKAALVGNLGIVMQARGDLDGAEAMYRKSLAIDEELGHREGMASCYGNLGNVMLTRGNLGGAEEMLRRALVINEELGEEEGIATQYGNLGNVLRIRGELDGAEAMYRKSLAINEELGLKKGIAIQYGNLGNVLRIRGDLDGAEAMYCKSLAINEELGRKEGRADLYSNLANLMETRGDLDGAEGMYRKSLAIDEELGRKEGMADRYDNLGIVMKNRGDLDGAEAMYGKSLAINEELGRKIGMANNYGNLGNVMKLRGELASARDCWEKSRELFTQVGLSHVAERVRSSLDRLPPA